MFMRNRNNVFAYPSPSIQYPMEYRVFQWWPRLLRNFNFHTFLKHPACESVQKGFRAAVFYFLWSNMRFLFVMVSHLLWILTFVCIDITMMNDHFFYIFLFKQLNVFSMFTLKWNVFNLILFCLLPRIYFLFSKTAFDWILNTWIITG